MKLGYFTATLVAPWFLNKTYKLDLLWIQFFVLYKIDDWAQIDLSTPTASKMEVEGKNGPKIATFKSRKKSPNFIRTEDRQKLMKMLKNYETLIWVNFLPF